MHCLLIVTHRIVFFQQRLLKKLVLKTIWNVFLTIFSHSLKYIRILLCVLVSKLWLVFIPYSAEKKIGAHKTCAFISLYLVQSNHIKIHEKELRSIGSNAFKWLCMYLCIDYLTDLHKMLQVSSSYGAYLEYQFWILLFLSFVDSNLSTQTNC